MNRKPWGLEPRQPVSVVSESAFLSYKLSVIRRLWDPATLSLPCHISRYSCADTECMGRCHGVTPGSGLPVEGGLWTCESGVYVTTKATWGFPEQ